MGGTQTTEDVEFTISIYNYIEPATYELYSVNTGGGERAYIGNFSRSSGGSYYNRTVKSEKRTNDYYKIYMIVQKRGTEEKGAYIKIEFNADGTPKRNSTITGVTGSGSLELISSYPIVVSGSQVVVSLKTQTGQPLGTGKEYKIELSGCTINTEYYLYDNNNRVGEFKTSSGSKTGTTTRTLTLESTPGSTKKYDIKTNTNKKCSIEIVFNANGTPNSASEKFTVGDIEISSVYASAALSSVSVRLGREDLTEYKIELSGCTINTEYYLYDNNNRVGEFKTSSGSKTGTTTRTLTLKSTPGSTKKYDIKTNTNKKCSIEIVFNANGTPNSATNKSAVGDIEISSVYASAALSSVSVRFQSGSAQSGLLASLPTIATSSPAELELLASAMTAQNLQTQSELLGAASPMQADLRIESQFKISYSGAITAVTREANNQLKPVWSANWTIEPGETIRINELITKNDETTGIRTGQTLHVKRSQTGSFTIEQLSVPSGYTGLTEKKTFTIKNTKTFTGSFVQQAQPNNSECTSKHRCAGRSSNDCSEWEIAAQFCRGHSCTIREVKIKYHGWNWNALGIPSESTINWSATTPSAPVFTSSAKTDSVLKSYELLGSDGNGVRMTFNIEYQPVRTPEPEPETVGVVIYLRNQEEGATYTLERWKDYDNYGDYGEQGEYIKAGTFSNNGHITIQVNKEKYDATYGRSFLIKKGNNPGDHIAIYFNANGNPIKATSYSPNIEEINVSGQGVFVIYKTEAENVEEPVTPPYNTGGDGTTVKNYQNILVGKGEHPYKSYPGTFKPEDLKNPMFDLNLRKIFKGAGRDYLSASFGIVIGNIATVNGKEWRNIFPKNRKVR